MKTLVSTFVFCAALCASAAAEPARTVHLERFELKNAEGLWVTVIEPDRTVDLDREEAKISFFNTLGRVPGGLYSNFRLTLTDGPKASGKMMMTRKEDFPEPFDFRKGSFVFAKVVPSGETPVRRVESIELTVDERSVTMAPDEIQMES